MGVQIIECDPHHLGLWIGFIHQPTHLMGEVLYGAPLGHRRLPPARQRLTGQEQVARPLPPVLLVLTPGTSRPGRQRGPGLGQQLGGGLVKADYRPLGVIGFGVQVQHVLHVGHVGHEIRAHLRDAPLRLPPRLESVFFETLADSLMGHRRGQPQFHHLASQQAQGPVVMSIWGRAAGQGDEVGFTPLIQLPGPAGAGPAAPPPTPPRRIAA